ncbi:MAG: CPBP family intramembrane metalloprotease [Chloroflexi bacterium]|nr:CPBP family intramembrane metalloprotease [Chloroflexota bacterium]
MPGILIFFVISGLIILANWLVILNNDGYAQLFDWLLLALSLLFLLMGLQALFAPPELLVGLQPVGLSALQDKAAFGATLIGLALWGALVGWRAGRGLLARWLPLNPASPVHALALFLSGVLAGSTLLTLTQGGLEGLAETAVSTPLADFVFQQLLFVIIALLGTGLLIRRRLPELGRRLGLERPSWSQIRFGLRWIGILIVVQWIVGLAWAIADPDQSELLGGVNDILLGNFDTVGEWIVVALGAGIGEELLFRGALQPIFGLWFTSFLFAVAHIQYGVTPITLLVFGISLALGHIRRQSNTAVAIFVHVGYDFILGLFYLLAVYLEPYASVISMQVCK